MRRRTGKERMPRLALVGCGAIAESFHLPALARMRGVMPGLLLVDPNRERARSLADRYPVAGILEDHREALDRVEGAIVAVPQQYHHGVARDFLEKGIHVLCEKPLATSFRDARDLVERARRSGARLAVNHTRRLYPASRKVRELIRDGALGPLRRLDFQEGELFDWPASPGSYFGRYGDGGGVLLDRGAHVLDLVCWWLDATPVVVSYRDDAHGGTEAVAELEFEADGCRGTVALSWLAKLRNSFCVEGTEATVEGTVYGWNTLRLASPRGRDARTIHVRGGGKGKLDFATGLLSNFVGVVRGREEPLVSGASVLPSLSLVDSCYAERRRFPMPWMVPHVATVDLRGGTGR